MKVQAVSFHLNGHIIGLCLQTQKLEPPYKTLSNNLAVKGLNKDAESKASTLGARDFSSTLSDFCQVFIGPSANTKNSHRSREKPLVPRVSQKLLRLIVVKAENTNRLLMYPWRSPGYSFDMLVLP